MISLLTLVLLSQSAPSWKDVDKLVSEHKYEAASKAVEARLKAAGTDDDERARTLVKLTQLRIGLGGYETAVKQLKAEAWPKAGLPKLAVELYYAHSLVQYLNGYSWEIQQREKVDTKGEVDLKAWTKAQIFEEAERTFESAWQQREALGGQNLGAFAEYLTPNDYPKGVRDTLRDALTYLRAELLDNQAYWSAEAANELYRLDFAALVKGSPGPSAVKLTDPNVHPVTRVAAMFDDLEGWHLKAGRREAALEARIARLNLLRRHFTADDERARVVAELEGRLEGVKDLPWSAYARAVLAGWLREQGDQVKAREVALVGANNFSQSYGGQRCNALVKAIEAPDFQLTGMQADGIERRSIDVSARNLKALFFRAYKVDVPSLLARSEYSMLPEEPEIRRLIASGTPVAKWTANLPATPDYQSHKSPVVPPLRESGMFVVVASAREDFVDKSNRIEAVDLLVTKLVMHVRQVWNDGAVDAVVVDGDSGQPLPGVDVELWSYEYGKPRSKLESSKTGADGGVRFTSKNRTSRSTFLVAHRGADWAIDRRPNYFNSRNQPDVTSALIFTDRSVFRPQQKVQWKVVAYKGNQSKDSYAVQANTEITVQLMDANYQAVETKKVKTNSYGSASGEFVIPAGRLLGQWSLTANGGSTWLKVEEYKRPTFQVSFKEAGAGAKLNAPVTLTGEARYYFGLPVTSGQVKWRVSRSPQWPWWWWEWGWSAPPSRTQVVAVGQSQVKPDGTFAVNFKPEADPKLGKDVTYRYEVSADLTDDGGETRSASKTMRLGTVAVEARASLDTGFVREGQPAAVTVRRTDLDGAGRSGAGSWQLVELKKPQKTVLPADEPVVVSPNQKTPAVQTDGDKQRPRYNPAYSATATMRRWADGSEAAKGELSHDQKGEAKVTLPKLAAGAYRLKYQTKDEYGAPFETSLDFVVAGAKLDLPLPALFIAESTSVKAGGTARFVVSSGLKGQALVLDVYRDNKRVDRKVVTAGKDGAVIELPVKEQDRGGFSVAVSATRDFQVMNFSANVFVPRDDKELKVELATFRDQLRPGAKETFRVTVKGQAEKLEAGAAEVLAYMYDQSLDVFGPHNTPSAMSLYASKMGVPWSQSTLGQAELQYVSTQPWFILPSVPSLREDQLKFFDSYGIGGPGGRGGMYRNRAMAVARGAPMAEMSADALAGESEAAPMEEAKKESRRDSAPEPMLGGLVEQKAKNKDNAGAPPPPPAPPGQGEAATVQVRSDFSETAFFKPHLVPDGNGGVSFDFTVPDSVTSWNVWAHAVTRDLRGGSVHATTRSVKDLMVRPYLPRFLREADEAAIKVVVNNASSKDLSGELKFEILDPDNGNKDLADEFQLKAKAPQPFTVKANGSATLTFPIKAPRRVGQVAVKAVAKTGDLSDGELRPVPLLPSRMHLAQSRFVTLKDKDERTMTFADLQKNDDATRVNEQLVVTIDAQLFFTVLQALPYLTRYPYECTEQTLNRFVSTGIVSSVFRDYPAMAKMAQGFAKRETPLETFDAQDPNRKLQLEESPWVIESKGGKDPRSDDEFINMLDPKVVAAERASALAKLRKAQRPTGAFPWFPGGPDSPWMTLYIAHGFAKAAEFKVEVPKDMVQRQWQYLATEYRATWRGCMLKGGCWESITFLNFIASSYPDETWVGGALTPEERKQMLDFSFSKWKQHSPYLKGYLALTLKRAGRASEAKLVFDSVMDSAKTTQDEGTFWQPEDRAWLWYNDTIESHAFALRALTELQPKDTRRAGLVQWLLLNKKMNQWKSTRATAEVIYSLVKYLDAEKSLAVKEESLVTVGPTQQKFVFEPDVYTGKKNQLVIPGAQLDPKTMSTVKVSKTTKGFQFASATWHFSTDQLPTEARGDFFQVSRTYFKREKGPKEVTLKPLSDGAKLEPGDELEVQLSIRSKAPAEYVHLRDPRGAGFEPEGAVSKFKWNLGIGWYEEYRDSGTNFFFETLPAGEYTFKYRVRAALGGTFRVGPATMQSMYAPEFNAYSQGHTLTIATGGK